MIVHNHVLAVFKVLAYTVILLLILSLVYSLYDFTVNHHRIEKVLETIGGVVSEYNCIPSEFVAFIDRELKSIVDSSNIFKSVELDPAINYYTPRDFGERFTIRILADVDIFVFMPGRNVEGNTEGFYMFANSVPLDYQIDVPCLRYLK